MKPMKPALLVIFFYSAVFCFGSPVMWVYQAEASSELAGALDYGAENLIDHTYRSWSEGVRGSGIGESFTLSFGEYGERTVAGFALKNGYGDLNYYNRNNRVQSFKIYMDDTYSETISVRDSIKFEQYAFKTPVKCGRIRFVIDGVYRGTVYDDTCVAEIALLADIVSGEDFDANILEWTGPPADGGSKYINNAPGVTNIPDADKIVLLKYMPFDFSSYKTSIALLDGPSALKLSGGPSRGLPRLDGATALYPLYSSFVHAVYPEKTVNTEADFQDFLDWGYFPNRETLRTIYDYAPIPAEFPSIVQCNKTAEAYRRLIGGEADIVFCYEPSAKEVEAAAAKGLRFHLTPIGKDAFVFLVNSKNPLNTITQRQIRDIYSGRLTNWKSITGVDEPVIPYQRPENSGSQTILQAIMKGDSIIKPILDGEYVPGHMFIMVNIVASDYYNYNSAIGYSFLYYVNKMADSSGVKVLSVDGVEPVKQTIQNNTYPFSQTIYAVTTGGESENTKKFIDWIISAQGQELVEKTGYIPIR
jgi:phosphate transport system substrate-binding protein